MQLQELPALARQSSDAKSLNGLLGFGFLASHREPFADCEARFADALRGELDRHVVALDEVFDAADAHSADRAAVLVALTPQTVEVVVDQASTAARVADAESAPACSAEEAAFQVVVVNLLLLACGGVGCQHRLDAFEEVSVDEVLMLSRVDGASESDVADVVGIGQHSRQRADCDGSGSSSPARSGCKPSVGKLLA